MNAAMSSSPVISLKSSRLATLPSLLVIMFQPLHAEREQLHSSFWHRASSIFHPFNSRPGDVGKALQFLDLVHCSQGNGQPDRSQKEIWNCGPPSSALRSNVGSRSVMFGSIACIPMGFSNRERVHYGFHFWQPHCWFSMNLPPTFSSTLNYQYSSLTPRCLHGRSTKSS